MSTGKEARIDDGLRGLVASYVNQDLPHGLAEQIQADAFDRLRPILEDAPVAQSELLVKVADDIRTYLWRGSSDPQAAVRFNNAYQRLDGINIIKNKAGILRLLQYLSDPRDVASDGESSIRSPPTELRLPLQKADSLRRPIDIEQPRTTLGKPRMKLADVSSARLNEQTIPGSPSKPHRGSQNDYPIEPRPSGSRDSQFQSKSQEEAEDTVSPITKSPTEAMLLRDLPFMLQGLSTTNLSFISGQSLALPQVLPLPLVSILHTLAEPSLLYRSLSSFVQAEHKGLIVQSLQAAIGLQLRSYLGLISTLEAEIRRSLTPESETTAKGISKVGVTLKRCVVWTRDATMGLRLMSLMAEEAQTQRGGALISMVHKYADSYGDPFVRAFAERMLSHLTQPFYAMLRQWIYEGELSDPYGEFFVGEQEPDDETKDLDPRKAPAASVWENKYTLKEDLVPTIITSDFARKVFLIGKSLNFIRYSCGSSTWVESYSKSHARELAYGDTATLETSIDIAYKLTMAHLIHLLDSRFSLFVHLDALKRYLLLGQGDFIALLLESLASNLDKPAGSQYRHTLTAQLDHAVRGSNAQYDPPDVLRRLDARLLELMHGEIGWDVFTLEYKVDAPCDVVVTTWASKQYLAVFNLLWRVKRIEFALGSVWRQIMTGARTVLAGVSGELGRDWKSARCVVAEMVHFVNQLQYYITFEVVEASWNELQGKIKREGVTLDEVIEAHTRYLKTITHRALLGGAKSGITGNRDDSFPSQLHKLLKTMLSYKEAVVGLYSFSVAEFTRKQGAAARADTRASVGRWGVEGEDDSLDSPLPGDRPMSGGYGREVDSPMPIIPGLSSVGEDHMLPALRKRLGELATEFRTRLETLLGDLLTQPDVDLKFLGVAMNFNDVYKPVRRKRRRDKEKAIK